MLIMLVEPMPEVVDRCLVTDNTDLWRVVVRDSGKSSVVTKFTPTKIYKENLTFKEAEEIVAQLKKSQTTTSVRDKRTKKVNNFN